MLIDLSPRAQERVNRSGGPVYNTCPHCGKHRFLHRKEAKRAAKKNHPGKALSSYECGGFYHYGHLSPEMLRGRRMRNGRIHPDFDWRPNPVTAWIMRAIWATTHPDPEQEPITWPLTVPAALSSPA